MNRANITSSDSLVPSHRLPIAAPTTHVNHCATPNSSCCASLHLLQILIELVKDREVSGLAALRPDKYATAIAALEVPLTLDAAVVLTSRFVERDADPCTNARNLGDKTGVAHCASARVRFGEKAKSAADSET